MASRRFPPSGESELASQWVLASDSDRYRQGIGSIIVNLMMQQINKKYPNDYILAMRIVWAPIGLIILCWA